MSRQRMCFRAVLLVTLACASIAAQAQGQADDAGAILKNMEYLRPLVGTWSAAAHFHHRDGSTTEEVGTYKISSVLEGTYLQWEVEFHVKGDPKRHHSFMTFVTYNPVTQKYDGTYLYSLWALRVTESGEYNDKNKEFLTTAFIPLEDGAHDENVRTITRLGNRNEIQYLHYSRYSHESAETMDLDVTLTRVR
jgi:hypothetical protein